MARLPLGSTRNASVRNIPLFACLFTVVMLAANGRAYHRPVQKYMDRHVLFLFGQLVSVTMMRLWHDA